MRKIKESTRVRVTLAGGGSALVLPLVVGGRIDWAGTMSRAAGSMAGVGAGAFVFERVGAEVWTMRRNLLNGEVPLLLIAALEG